MNQLTTTSYIDNGIPTETIIHTSTSCHQIDKVLTTVKGDNPEAVKLIISMHKALMKSLSFVEGFENDDINDAEILLADLKHFAL